MNNTAISALDDFFEKFSFVKYKKGEVLINADEDPPGIFYLKSGTVRQYSLSRKGDEQTLTIYKPFSFFPLMWAINNTRNTFYFEALKDIEAWKAPRDETIKFLKAEPEVMYDLISRLYQGMEGLLSRIEYLMFGTAYEKVIFTLLNLSFRFGEENMSNLDVNLHITHKDIASFSGLRKETISRQIAKLHRKRILENKNRLVIIKDIERLQDELTGD